MKFNLKQVNNLNTGVQLEAELIPSSDRLRRFICVKGYYIDENGKYRLLSKILNKSHEIFYEVESYEIPVEYFENNWEVIFDILENYFKIDKIKTIEELEKEILNYMEDFSKFVPSWESENIY